jgi:hypothetical protein
MTLYRAVSVLVLVLSAGPAWAGWFATDPGSARYPRAYYGLGSAALQFGYHRFGSLGRGGSWFESETPFITLYCRVIEARRFFGRTGVGLHLGELYDSRSPVDGWFGSGTISASLLGVSGHFVTATGSHGFQYLSVGVSCLPVVPIGIVGRVEYSFVPFAPVPAEAFAAASGGYGTQLFGGRYGYWQAAAGLRVGLGWWVMEERSGRPGFGLDR